MTTIPISIVIADTCAVAIVLPGTQMWANVDPGLAMVVSKAGPRIAGADPLVFTSR